KPPSLLDQFRRPGFWIGLIAVVIINYLIVNVFLAPQQPQQVTISYTEFKRQVTADNVTTITSQGDTITGVTRKQVSGQANGTQAKTTHFMTQRPAFADNDLEPLLEQHGVTINATPVPTGNSTLLNVLLSFGPTILLVLGFLYLRRQMSAGAGGAFGFGQSRARLYDPERPSTTFKDVAG